MQDPQPWWVAAFGAEYPDLYPKRDLESARAEIGGLVRAGLLRGGRRVLDLCCGFGRHSLALQESGAWVVGVDYSAALLAHARSDPDYRRVHPRLLRGDARHLPLRTGVFDALVNLFSSFGYFGSAGDRALLEQAARVLRPEGLAVFDSMNADLVRQQLVPHSRVQRGETQVEEHRWLEQGGKRVVKQVEWWAAPAAPRRWREEVTLFDPADLDLLLEAAGFDVERRVGDYQGAPFDSQSPRQIVWARRRI